MNKLVPLIFLLSTSSAMAVDSPITGQVQPKCSVWTETSGDYGHQHMKLRRLHTTT